MYQSQLPIVRFRHTKKKNHVRRYGLRSRKIGQDKGLTMTKLTIAGGEAQEQNRSEVRCLVCSGQTTLADTQEEILNNWQFSYHRHSKVKCQRHTMRLSETIPRRCAHGISVAAGQS